MADLSTSPLNINVLETYQQCVRTEGKYLERPWQLQTSWIEKSGWFLNNYDVIRDNNMVYVQMLNGIAEIYSTVRKSMKENKECTNGD